MKRKYTLNLHFVSLLFFLAIVNISYSQINFGQSNIDLNGLTNFSQGITALEFGPDGKLYVAEYPGTIKVLTIQKVSANNYKVVGIEVLTGLSNIQNHNDNGTLNSSTQRETTGLKVVGTPAIPVIYVASSDIRIGGGGGTGDLDVNLDTNSGIITRFTRNGGGWNVVDMVRGLPRSEENHATNGLEFTTINNIDYLIVAQGGHTNGGSPSKNFAYTNEYALSGAVLSINLTALEAMSIKNDNGRNYIYDLPTLDDPTRANVGGIVNPNDPGYTGVDVNDPFGGNDGLNQAKLVAGGPVEILSPGYRNAYDLVLTQNGALYVTDNGANTGWGGFPINEGTSNVNNNYDPNETGGGGLANPAPDGEYINNLDHLQLVTTDILNYTFGSYYGGHPNPTRANPSGAGLYTYNGTNNVWRTQTFDPSGTIPGSTTMINSALPADWPPVSVANSVEGDWRGPGLQNPEGPNDDIITVWGTNTNAIAEYTASNFGGAMQGNLIAGVSSGILRRVELNPDGSLNKLTSSFLSGIGGNALGLTAQGDGEVFAGTIWVGTLNGNLVIFEPSDAVNCVDKSDPLYDALADYDNDGYTNQDEEDNGTDPCNGGSQPADFDKSAGAPFISDLNDNDDDNDGVLDSNDPFQLGDPNSAGSDAFEIPITNELFNDQQGLGGIFGLGMTGLMNNGASGKNWLDWIDRRAQAGDPFDPNEPNPNDVLGGAPGLMTSHMRFGTAKGSSNNQEKAYQFGVQVDQSTGKFTIESAMRGFNDVLQLYGNSAAIGGELGIFLGDGTQSNFVQFVISQDGLSAIQEVNDVLDVSNELNLVLAPANRPDSDLIFYIVVDPVIGTLQLDYKLDSNPRQTLGTLTATGNTLAAIQNAGTDLAVGFIGTSNNTGVELEGTWDYLKVVTNVPSVSNQIPDFQRFVGSSDDNIELENFFADDMGNENLTYSIVNNTNPTEIGANISGNILTLSYPISTQSADITIRATDEEGLFVEQSFNVEVTDTPSALYRVNVGGPQISNIDGGIDWSADTAANNSAFLVTAGTNNVGTYGATSYTSEVNQSTTPLSIYNTERYDANSALPNVTYSFPVPSSGNYEIRLYMANGWSGTSAPGQRIFNVALDGVIYPELKNIDLSKTYGHKTGTVISHTLNITDGSIDISLLHVGPENPLLNGIEILEASDLDTPIYVSDIADQLNYVGDELNASLAVAAYGGDGNLNYAISGQPAGVSIEPTNGNIVGSIDNGAVTGSPYNVTITVNDSDGLNNDVKTISFIWTIEERVTYRINSAGAFVNATDNGPGWEYNGVAGAYQGVSYGVNTGQIYTSTLLNKNRDVSVPAYVDETTFASIFGKERYDVQAAPEMEYTIPVENGDYVVQLYLGNSFAGASQVGNRLFDILLEGAIVADNFDVIAAFGHNVGGMLSYPVNVTDGVLNIGFGHVIENPIISAIEIYKDDNSLPALTLNSFSNQNDAPSDTVSITANANGGDTAETFEYYISGQPEGVTINMETGVISGIIGANASIGGPNSNGIHNVTVTVKKLGSVPQSQSFIWQVTPSWIDKNENENYTARHENSFVQAGNKFYLMGGRESAKTIDIYDYTSNTWKNLVNSAPEEFNHFQATEYKGLIWVIGALKTNTFPSETPADYIWAFDPSEEEWIQGPEIPNSRKRGSTGLVVYNDKFYVVGGNTNGHSGGYVPWFDSYDPLTGVWTPLQDAPHARDHFNAVLIGEKMYLAGGRLSGGAGGTFAPTIPEIDVYDFANATWSTLPVGENIPTARAGAAAVNYNNRLVVIGGETATAGPSLKITEEYDPALQSWRQLPEMNSPRHGTQAIVSGNGIFILAGSPVRGGGQQKNMEFLGEDNPVGNPSISSSFNVPAGVQIADGTSKEVTLALTDGNVGAFVRSMEITGTNAADFSITSGQLENSLIYPNSSRVFTVALSGSGANRSAILTINYGANSSLDILLSNENIAPVVTNPGNQYNYEGDTISLPVNASDEGNLSYSATGLPPVLNIDPTTGIISGIISEGNMGNGAFQEENGLVVIEAESGNTAGWAITTANGATGILANTNSFNAQNGATIPYAVNIETPGVYRFTWRSFFSGPSATDENDNWLRFPNNDDVWFFGFKGTPTNEASLISNLQGSQTNIVFPNGSSRVSAATAPEGASSNGYLKIFRSGGTSQVYNWQAKTSDNDSHDVYVYFVNPGTYTMEISERSAGHAIDKVALYKVDGPNYSSAQLTAAPESQVGGTIAGAAENSPYDVQITVNDDADPSESTTIDFKWFINTIGSPLAVIEADPISGTAPLEVAFTGNGSMDDIGIVNYAWNFADGNTSNEVNPTHTFTAAGNYEVSLTVTDGDSNTATSTILIEVLDPSGNEPPVAIASSDVSNGDAPLTVNFTGSGSTDDVSIASYLWEFGDVANSTSTAADPSFIYTDVGVYTVTLTVTDGNGLTNATPLEITVNSPNEAPVAIATSDVSSGDAPLTVTFTGSNSTDDVSIASYLWEFGDVAGSTSAEADPSFVFTDAGVYTVTLTVTDGDGLTNATTLVITVNSPNGAPMAIATSDVSSGDAPLTVAFTGSNSTDDVSIASYLWEFGDVVGSTSAEADPSFVFTDAGVYTVTLTVTDGDGLTNATTLEITVNSPNGAPVAIATSDVSNGDAPLTVAFTGSNSTDDVSITSYLWEFGDVVGSTSTEADPSFMFTDAGVYIVTLTVTDGDGLTNATTLEITVNSPNGAPVAIATSDVSSGDAPLTVAFTGSNSTDDISIESYLWEFGDVAGSTSAEADPSFVFTDAGVYTVTLTVTDGDGLTNATTLEITVNTPVDPNNEAPVAAITANPINGLAPLPVLFSAENATDDKGIVRYEWDFNDGTTSTIRTNGSAFSHTFAQAGTYQVVLTVTDEEGLTDSATITITVSDTNAAPNAIATATPLEGDAPLEVTFDGSASIDDVAIISYNWDFGDGTSSNEISPVHTYEFAGEFNVILTVSDGEFTDTDQLTIVVSDNIPSEVGNFEAIVAPNPVVDGIANIIMVTEPIDDFITIVYLHDASGRYISGHLAQTIYDAGNYKIPTYGLRSGIYFVTLLTEKGDALGLKIMVNN